MTGNKINFSQALWDKKYLVAEIENSNFATKFNFRSYTRLMIWGYIICSIAVVHTLFLLYPVYRDEALDIYSWKPWTEKDYVLFKSVTKQ